MRVICRVISREGCDEEAGAHILFIFGLPKSLLVASFSNPICDLQFHSLLCTFLDCKSNAFLVASWPQHKHKAQKTPWQASTQQQAPPVSLTASPMN